MIRHWKGYSRLKVGQYQSVSPEIDHLTKGLKGIGR